MSLANLAGDIALDLETTGVDPGCSVLSIGAATVDGLDSFYVGITLSSNHVEGLWDNESTLDWWRKQDKVAKLEAFTGRETLRVALHNFADWLEYISAKHNRPVNIWGNGAGFDLPILAAAYKACEFHRPWEYKQERCFRTVKALFPQVAAPAFVGTPHIAINDAAHEARHLALILEYMAKIDSHYNDGKVAKNVS